MDRYRRFLAICSITAFALVYMMFTGMVETFGARDIVADVIDLGRILIYLSPFVAGYWVGRTPLARWQAGIGAGLVTTAPAALLTLIMERVSMRDIFINASPSLVDFLALGIQPLGAGMLVFWALGGLASGAGLGFSLLPRWVRKAIIVGLAILATMALMSDLVGQILRQITGGRPDRILFSANALRIGPAIAVFGATVALTIFLPALKRQTETRVLALLPTEFMQSGYAAKGLGLIVLLALPWTLGVFLSEVLANVGLFMLMALGLNIAVGLAGLFDLGYVTNFAVGAYLVGILTSTGPQGVGHFNFWMILPVSIVAAMFTGFMLALPVVRMRGDYLAIATLGFGEIIRLLALSDWFVPLIGGAQGVLFIPKPSIAEFSFQTPQQLYYIILAACVVVLFVSQRLDISRTGRQWRAIREDEQVANAMGIDVTWVKTLAFTLSAASGGLAGAIFASKLGTIFPHSFQLLISINVLCIIIIGGMASIPGIALGSLLLVGVPELLREFSEYRYLFYGLLLILMTLYRPQGLLPVKIQRHDRDADSTSRPPVPKLAPDPFRAPTTT